MNRPNAVCNAMQRSKKLTLRTTKSFLINALHRAHSNIWMGYGMFCNLVAMTDVFWPILFNDLCNTINCDLTVLEYIHTQFVCVCACFFLIRWLNYAAQFRIKRSDSKSKSKSKSTERLKECMKEMKFIV